MSPITPIVPARLIGATLTVRLRAETVEVYVGAQVVCAMPRLSGRQQHRIAYQHVIWSLVRKPGAFAAYRYRDDLFPTLVFRRAYDLLTQRRSERADRADREYVRVLHLAATTSEAEVETALSLCSTRDGSRPSTQCVTWCASRSPSRRPHSVRRSSTWGSTTGSSPHTRRRRRHRRRRLLRWVRGRSPNDLQKRPDKAQRLRADVTTFGGKSA
jgi:hypothetical protein